MGGSVAVEPLTALARGASANTRITETEIAPDVVPAIWLRVANALRDEDPEVRIGAAFAIGQFGTLVAYEQLEQQVTTEPDEDVRGQE